MERRTVASLLDPISLAGLDLRNRVVMAPMARRFARDGVPDPAYIDYFAKRAAGGVGLILTDATGVAHPSAARTPEYPRMEPGPAEPVWRSIAAAVQAGGARFLPQLYHAGATRRPGDLPNAGEKPFSPSGIFLPLDGRTGAPPEQICDGASEADIRAVIAAFGESAALAEGLGCDGIEIHGAHGYAIDQFLWSKTNQRDDDWGGDIMRRARLAIEIVRECRARTGAGFLISFRLSQWKQQDFGARLADTPEDLAKIVVPLSQAGADIFHCSTRRFWEAEFAGSDLNLAGWVKAITGKPTITVGSVGLNVDFVSGHGSSAEVDSSSAADDHFATLMRMLDRGDFDLVAIGRALVANPDWMKSLSGPADLQPYSADLLKTLA